MKKQNQKSLFNYLSDQFIGRFTGFIIGLWASQLVHHFFTTRSIHNLWGLTAKKTVVSKQTFGHLEWMSSVLIGYIVFEIVLRILKNKVGPWSSALRFRLLRRIVERGWKLKRFRLRNEGVWGLWHFAQNYFQVHLKMFPPKTQNSYLCPPKKEGSVVQLVRMLPCHGRGRGFESRPVRKTLRSSKRFYFMPYLVVWIVW